MHNSQEPLVSYADSPESPPPENGADNSNRGRRILFRRFRILPFPEDRIIPPSQDCLTGPVRITPIVREVSAQRMAYLPATTLEALYAQLATIKEVNEEKVAEVERRNRDLELRIEALQKHLHESHGTWLRAYHEPAHSLPMTVVNGKPGQEIRVDLMRDNRTVIIKSWPLQEDEFSISSPESPPQEWPYETDL